jgi:hypothetical protein
MDETLEVFEQVAHYFGLLADPTRCAFCPACVPTSVPFMKWWKNWPDTSQYLTAPEHPLSGGVVDRRREGIQCCTASLIQILSTSVAWSASRWPAAIWAISLGVMNFRLTLNN